MAKDKVQRKKKEKGGLTATTRDGTVLSIGDTVTTNFHGCRGHEFTICEINPYEICESKFLVVAHLKDSPDRKIRTSFKFQGEPEGVDANWFKKVE